MVHHKTKHKSLRNAFVGERKKYTSSLNGRDQTDRMKPIGKWAVNEWMEWCALRCVAIIKNFNSYSRFSQLCFPCVKRNLLTFLLNEPISDVNRCYTFWPESASCVCIVHSASSSDFFSPSAGVGHGRWVARDRASSQGVHTSVQRWLVATGTDYFIQNLLVRISFDSKSLTEVFFVLFVLFAIF